MMAAGDPFGMFKGAGIVCTNRLDLIRCRHDEAVNVDDGGLEKLLNYECRAFKQQATCCARQVGIVSAPIVTKKPPKTITKAEKEKARMCILDAKYGSSLPFGQVHKAYKKVCADKVFSEDLLSKVEKVEGL